MLNVLLIRPIEIYKIKNKKEIYIAKRNARFLGL